MDKRDHKLRYDAGLKTRRDVLGAEWVDKAGRPSPWTIRLTATANF